MIDEADLLTAKSGSDCAIWRLIYGVCACKNILKRNKIEIQNNEFMKDRIKIVMDYAKLSQQDFSHKLGVSPASLSSIFTGRTNPTNNHVQAIHRVFPEINVSWLLFGEGEMLLSSERLMENSSILGENSMLNEEEQTVPASIDGMGLLFSETHETNNAALLGTPSMPTVVSPGAASAKREAAYQRRSEARQAESVKQFDRWPRKIKEIRVFFDDGTYEAFVPSGK